MFLSLLICSLSLFIAGSFILVCWLLYFLKDFKADLYIIFWKSSLFVKLVDIIFEKFLLLVC